MNASAAIAKQKASLPLKVDYWTKTTDHTFPYEGGEVCLRKNNTIFFKCVATEVNVLNNGSFYSNFLLLLKILQVIYK